MRGRFAELSLWRKGWDCQRDALAPRVSLRLFQSASRGRSTCGSNLQSVVTGDAGRCEGGLPSYLYGGRGGTANATRWLRELGFAYFKAPRAGSRPAVRISRVSLPVMREDAREVCRVIFMAEGVGLPTRRVGSAS